MSEVLSSPFLVPFNGSFVRDRRASRPDKPFMRLAVAGIIRQTRVSLSLEYPKPDAAELAPFDEMRRLLDDG